MHVCIDVFLVKSNLSDLMLLPIEDFSVSDTEFLSNLQAPYGPPFALIQGILEAQGTPFKKIPTEACPSIRRGSVAWIGTGPEFFISLANHEEWKNSYTVFGSVLLEDMEIAEKIAQLPTKPDVWSNINVSVLQKPVPLTIRRMTKSLGDVNTNMKSE